MNVFYVPTMKQRRRAMLGCGSYHNCFSRHLWAPIRMVPAGMYPFGREPVATD